jgi:hypothetical protein
MRVFDCRHKVGPGLLQFGWVEGVLDFDPFYIWELFRLCSNGKYIKVGSPRKVGK